MATDIIARGMAGSTKKALDEYKNNPDVSDIVATKADLTNYDTSKLNVNDIVKVLVDESQDNKQTYYKWTGTTFQYVGGLGPYYTTTEIDNKINASYCYYIGDDDLNVDTGEISSRFKALIENKATFKYVGTDNGVIIHVNNINAINKTFIPVEDKDADGNGFYLYQTTYISVDTAQPEISIIKFYVSNSNILTTQLAAHSSLSDIGWIAPQIQSDTDDYIYSDSLGILFLPRVMIALNNVINNNIINTTKIFNFQIIDNNNLINTLPEDTKIMIGSPSDVTLPILDINSNITFNTGDTIAPIMTVGSIKRFRICDDDPILKDSYIFSGYAFDSTGIVVITERSTNQGSGGSGKTLKIIEFRDAFTNADPLQVGMTSDNWNSLLSIFSQALGTTITEDNIQTVWTNSSDYEKMTVIKYVMLMKSFATFGSITVLDIDITETTVDGVDVVTSIDLIGGGIGSQPNYYNSVCASNLSDMSGALLYITTIGGGNGASTSGGALYEFDMSVSTYDNEGVIKDTNQLLQMLIYESNFERIKTQALQLGVTINTPNDLVTLINTNFNETTGQQYSTQQEILTSPAGVLAMLVNLADRTYVGGEVVFNQNLLYLAPLSNQSYAAISLNYDNGEESFTYGINVNNSCTLTQYGTSSGSGSSSTETYYKITLTDYNDDGIGNTLENDLILCLRKSDFDFVLTEINTQMGTNLQTPQDLIDFYDTVKGDSNYYGGCCLLFSAMAEMCLGNNTNAVYRDYDLRAYNKVTTAIGTPIPTVASCNMVVISALNPNQLTSIFFTSNSTLAITEQNNQNIL